MKDTFFGVPKDPERISRMMSRYCLSDSGELEKMPLECKFNFTEEYESGGAGLTSSAEDYALLVDALANGGVGKSGNRILSSHTVQLMGMNQVEGQVYEDFNELRPGYGYGLGVRTHMDKKISGTLSPIGEFGWDGAAGGFSLVDTKNKLSLTHFQEMHGWELRWQYEMRNILYSCLEL
jgi:CubicO group peptidase (beta-lactamase class C family)